jgi:alkylhydroperoxidase/carboxymuconolactone decarboxylase family protein YurZ
MTDGSPVLDTLTDITAASVEHNSLAPRDFILARVAALIAVDAPPVSWLANADPIEEAGLTAEDIQGIMIAVAPIVGAPRVMAAGGHILRALGFAIAVAEDELDEELAELDDDDDGDE